ncbi:MAG: hypothetical protein A2W25_04410 [candidate division Zixibacteria bacterium RBG_16_53_22]|nr:MAG: hypothetical protein A2W25_04410 [candidate division Zixibacteria bacterium RBG_16_53_22]
MNMAWVLIETDTAMQQLPSIKEKIERILRDNGMPVRVLIMAQNNELHVVSKTDKQPIPIPKEGCDETD